MQTSTGQKVFCIPALLLFSFVTSPRSSVEKMSEKMSTPRAGFSTSRRSCATPQTCSSDLRTAKTLNAAKTPRTAKILLIASWYGEEFEGRQTASGELFDPSQLTAASRTLPLGSRVRLTARSTGRSVVVRINDRGPWLKGRDLDLSEAAATVLGIHDKGISTVEMAFSR